MQLLERHRRELPRYNLALRAQLTATIHPAMTQATSASRRAASIRCQYGWAAICAAMSMIDFTKPLSFRVNTQQVLNKVMVKPSLKVMLEDLYMRADRQRVYMVKLDWPKSRNDEMKPPIKCTSRCDFIVLAKRKPQRSKRSSSKLYQR